MSASEDPASAPQTEDHQRDTIDALKEALARIEAGDSPSSFDPAEESAPVGSGSATAPASGSPAEPPLSLGTEAPDEGDERDRARNLVLRKLTGSAKSRHQLAEALREKEFSQEVITSVLDRLEEVQLIDDAAFARMWIRTRHETRGLGRSALRRELKDRGIAEETAEEALEQLSDADEASAARELIAKKMRGVTVPPGQDAAARKEREKHTRRLVSMLARRGHSPGAAFQLVREALDEHTAGGAGV
ncbi:regulatory protein RecX [Nesterenkonia xinjiangensis]|uniref:Regulatory protein RecX n=1 Tax=Nesterenkonia xinjiangensis TaxID=225327 RepID=A0A7Z0GN99_9MICC|nr:regulatory protein RecX [Nesterenkonia xinjiangensis]NYJ79157.1 regulatory protein [Nesterenkonia xinjiangensis]